MARRVATTAAAACVLSLVVAAPAGAKLFTVTSAADAAAAGAVNDGVCTTASDGCTLRAAIQEANGTTGSDEIALPARDYVLNLPTNLAVSTNVTINGEGARTTTIDAGGDSTVFDITGGSVVMNGLSITGGVASGAGGLSMSGTSSELILDRVAVHGNKATGAVGNQSGGGINVFQGGLIVRRSAIYDNQATASSNNQASGAGVFVNGTATSATFETVTIASNSSTSETGITFGGGITSSAPLTLRHVTMVDNVAGHGGNLYESDLSKAALENSVLARGGFGADCNGGSGSPVSHGVNLADDTSCSLPAGSVAPAKLEAFGDHGGLTFSAPPQLGSPALDVASACPDAGTDQRGQAAPTGPGCDLGAAELGADLSATLTPSASSVNAGDSLTYVEVLRNNGLDAGAGTLEFTPPAGSTVTFASSLGGSCAGTAPVVCSYDPLAPGNSVAATIVVKVPASGPLTAFSRASGPVPDFDGSNNLASATGAVVPAPPPPDTSDKTKPILGGLRLSGKLSRKKGGKLRYVLSEDATLTIRLGKVGTQQRSGKAGEHVLKLFGRWGKKRPKRGKKYKLTVVATDAAGNKSTTKSLKLRVRR